jgi:hypothetical protein
MRALPSAALVADAFGSPTVAMVAPTTGWPSAAFTTFTIMAPRPTGRAGSAAGFAMGCAAVELASNIVMSPTVQAILRAASPQPHCIRIVFS